MGGKAGGPEAREINGVKFIAQVLSGVSGKDLPSLIDEMKARIGSGAVVLIVFTITSEILLRDPMRRIAKFSAARAEFLEAGRRNAEALQAMAEQLQAWRRAHPQATLEGVEFDLFGFSRGAAAVRHLANLLHEGAGGLLSVACETSINFIGLFDTVAAIIAPLQGDFDPADGRHGGLRLGLGAGIARHVVQLVAEDERRHNFPLVRSGHDIVLPGVHSNIGGGYPETTLEQVLLSSESAYSSQCAPRTQRRPTRHDLHTPDRRSAP